MMITLPLPPNLANSRMHWRVKNRERQAYFTECAVMLNMSHQNRASVVTKWHRPEKATIKATIYCGGRMDDDNAIARLKWPVDWMVQCGFLAGDKSSQLSWDWPITQVVKRDGNYRVVFELEAA